LSVLEAKQNLKKPGRDRLPKKWQVGLVRSVRFNLVADPWVKMESPPKRLLETAPHEHDPRSNNA